MKADTFMNAVGLISDRHCSTYSTPLSRMYIGHDPYLAACGKVVITHSSDLLYSLVLYYLCVADGGIYFPFNLKHIF